MSIVSVLYNEDNDTLTEIIDFKQIELNQCFIDNCDYMNDYRQIFNGDNRFIIMFPIGRFNKYKTSVCNVSLLYCKGNKIIIFKYTDELYYTKYEEDLFNSFKQKRIRGSYVYIIPCKYLTKFKMTDKNISV